MNDVEMAQTNGVTLADPAPTYDSPTPNILGATIKRKRVDSDEAEEHINGDLVNGAKDKLTTNIHDQIKNLLVILREHSTVPSLFEQPLAFREESKEPELKRARLEDSSINARISANFYSSLDDVVADIKLAAKLFKEERKLPSADSKALVQPLSPSDSDLLKRIDGIVGRAVDLVQRQKVYDDILAAKPVKSEVNPTQMTNGTHGSGAKFPRNTQQGPLALSVLGPNNKLMYTSAQGVMSDISSTVSYPIRQTALPNGITTVHAMSATAPEDEKRQNSTLGDLFTTGTSLPFVPSKPSRSSSGKNLPNGWMQQSVFDNGRPRNSQSYYNQQISSGQWLEYRGATKDNDPRRKQRDRALSLSGVKATLSSEEAEEQEAQELNALFRSAYSTFAPTRDDSAAVIPEQTLNRMWWQQIGHLAFEKLVENVGDMVLDGQAKKAITASVDDSPDFKYAVDHWNDVIDPSLAASASPATAEKAADEKDVDELLDQISELLEALSTSQRNRNLAFPIASRPSAVLAGAPSVSEPDQSEIDMYSILKNQLSVMIAMLPPYAVAKLNSDQLSELAISTKIPIEVESAKGTMEEEEHATRAKLAAVPPPVAARSTPAPSHHRSGSSVHYGNQFNTAPRPTSGTAQYYNTSTPARNAPPIRPPQTAGPIPYGNAAARGMPVQQPQYRPPQQQYGTPTPAHQAPRPVPPQYPQNAAGYYNTPAASSRFPTANGMPGNVQQPMRYPPNPSTPNFQQRPLPQTNGSTYTPFNANPPPSIQRQPSPQKPMQPAPPVGQYNSHAQSVQQPPRNFPSPAPAAQGYYGNSMQSMGMTAGVPMPPSMQQQIANGGSNLSNLSNMSNMPNVPNLPATNTNSNANLSSVAANSNASPMVGGGMAANGIAGGGIRAGSATSAGSGGAGGSQTPADSVLLGYRTTMSEDQQRDVQERARERAQNQIRLQAQNGLGAGIGAGVGLQGQTQGQAPAQGPGGMNGN